MVKPTLISEAFKFKQRLIENKQFLVNLEKTKTNKSRVKLLHSANSGQLHILRDLIKSIHAKDIEISKSILKSKKKVKVVIDLINKFQKTPSIYKSDSFLRRFLLKFVSVLPIIAKTVLL